jgi:protein tyrosine phosphatase (PTP) superfamily phosphohydrolase (DUF442 family)
MASQAPVIDFATPPPSRPLSRAERFRAWMNMLWVDHSIFRFFFNTRHRIAPDCYRSSHPMPYQLRAAARAGVRAVLNLRGGDVRVGSNLLEWHSCAELGLALGHYSVASRDAPSRENILRIKELFDVMPRPLLLHCKSGADRAGLASVLYLMLEQGQPLESAMRELSFWRYGHVRQAKTGILDHFFECYKAHRDAHGTAFLDWVRHYYDRDAVRASFHSSWWANQLVDWVLRRESGARAHPGLPAPADRACPIPGRAATVLRRREPPLLPAAQPAPAPAQAVPAAAALPERGAARQAEAAAVPAAARQPSRRRGQGTGFRTGHPRSAAAAA